MMRRRGGKGGSWALFLPRGFEGLVLFPPASLPLSPHTTPAPCCFRGLVSLPLFIFPSLLQFPSLQYPAHFE